MKKLITLLIVSSITLQSHAQWSIVGSAFTGTVRAVYFADENTGYAAGGDGATTGYVAKTTDGGVTWTSSSVSGTILLRSISFVDANTGYICGHNGVVLKTTDAGATWTNIYTDATQTFRAIDFVSSTTGFMAGAAGTIWKTTTSGTSWSSYSLGVASDIIQVHMVDANTGYACASTGTAPFANGYVFKTSDGGASWTQVYYNATIGMLGLAVVDANTAFAGGTNQTIIKTADGGSTWSSVFTGLTGPAIRAGFAASSNKIFMADDAGYVQSSSDGGTTWSNDLVGTSGGLFCLSFPSASVGYSGDVIGSVFKYAPGSACTVTAPTDLTSVVAATKAELYWTAPLGATKYTLRYASANSSWTLKCSQPVRIVKNLTPNTKYTWSVKAYCGSPTSGSSEWSAKVSFITPAQKLDESQDGVSFEVFPNPVSTIATINFSLDQDSKVTASLFTVDGKKVMTIADDQFPSGENQLILNRGSLSSGLYVLQVKTNDNLLVKKIEIE